MPYQRFTDSMHCNYYIELCALIFLVAITVAYFTRKKFPVATARLFGVGCIFLTANAALDILFCVLLDNSNVVPIGWVELVADLFFGIQFVISYCLFAYVFYSIGRSLRYHPIFLLTTIPSAIGLLFFLTNGLHHLNFNFVLNTDPKYNNTYDFIPGPGFMSLYIINWGMNYLATLVYTFRFRKVLPKELMRVLLIVMVVVLSAAAVQTVRPQTLLSGASFALCAMFAVVSVCDPDIKVDRVSKAFNDYAFVDYLNNQRLEKQRKYYILFEIESFGLFN